MTISEYVKKALTNLDAEPGTVVRFELDIDSQGRVATGAPHHISFDVTVGEQLKAGDVPSNNSNS
jgi:hypothetical protein